MKLSYISKIALIVFMGAAVPAQGETQELTPQQEILNAMVQASIPETYECIMHLYNTAPGDLRFIFGAMSVMLEGAQRDKTLDQKDIQNKITLLRIAVEMQLAKEDTQEAEDALKDARRSGISENMNSSPRWLEARQQGISKLQELLKKRAQEFEAQAKQ